MKETQMHYVKQMFFGLSEELQQFMIKDLESQLTLEQIEESKQTSEQIYSILSKMDSLLLSHQSTNLNFLYCEHLLNSVDDASVPVFIDLLELHFTKKALNGFMLIAAQKTLAI